MLPVRAWYTCGRVYDVPIRTDSPESGTLVCAMTPKMKRFAEEYLNDLNATAAYKRAGYKATGHAAEVNASRLLSNAEVKAFISSAKQARSQSTGITAERILRELECLANSDLGDILDFSGEQPKLKPANQIPERARRAISSVKIKRVIEGTGDFAQEVEVIEFKLWDKPGSITKAMQHLGMLVEKHEHAGPGGGPIKTEVTHDLTSTVDRYADAVGEIIAARGKSCTPCEPTGASPGIPAPHRNGKPMDSRNGTGKAH
jgi:phage terminase small subunit